MRFEPNIKLLPSQWIHGFKATWQKREKVIQLPDHLTVPCKLGDGRTGFCDKSRTCKDVPKNKFLRHYDTLKPVDGGWGIDQTSSSCVEISEEMEARCETNFYHLIFCRHLSIFYLFSSGPQFAGMPIRSRLSKVHRSKIVLSTPFA